ncbi:cytochrome c peroxidase [Myroides phaeus]|nr:cytochrome c peroxidase [Myroides phaeus]MEC4116852.1 cytochrome c peroxidase [Myroides phaeus]
MNPVEHNIKNEKELEERIQKIDLYKDLFAQVYKDEKQPISFGNITNAIGAFERTLNPESRFDKFLDGDEKALTAQEQKGLETFMSVGCITCHNGVALGGQMFQKFGVYKNYWELTESEKIDNGLYDLTKEEVQKYLFKVPGLRNVTNTAPYFHDGSVSDLKRAIEIMGIVQNNITLDAQQLDDIAAFLGSLSSDLPDSVKKSPF